jgi:hypothetical protein
MFSHQLPDVACMKAAAAGGVVAGAVGAGMATALTVTVDGNERAPVKVISVKVTGYAEFVAKYTAEAALAESAEAPQDALEPLLTRLLMPTTATAERTPTRTMAIRISIRVKPLSSCSPSILDWMIELSFIVVFLLFVGVVKITAHMCVFRDDEVSLI